MNQDQDEMNKQNPNASQETTEDQNSQNPNYMGEEDEAEYDRPIFSEVPRNPKSTPDDEFEDVMSEEE